jgi:uncharacterized coiled-coil DUF342 family protein
MTWSALQLRGISFLGPVGKSPALLEFQSGLNVICGASETGKSFIVEAIDFLLGGSDPLRDIPERVGYDRARLVLQETDDSAFTLERSTSGGGFRRYDGNWLSGTPEGEPVNLRERHASGREDTLSAQLLAATGLVDQLVRRNKQGRTHNLSFRDLARLIVVQENEITKRFSPIFSGQWVNKTVEYSVFKLLLTGVDDSALVENAVISRAQQSNTAKVELVDEWLATLLAEIDELGIDRKEAEDQLGRIQATFEQQRENLRRVQNRLDEGLSQRRQVQSERESVSGRIEEINDLLSRFALLKTHYQIDLERLAAIEESGSLFIHVDRKPCPLCGALPGEQHQPEGCDGDIESVVNAATAEIAKVQRLSTELDQTVADLIREAEHLTGRRAEIEARFQELDREIRETLSPDLGDVRATFTELVEKSAEVRRIVEMFDRVDRLEEQKASLTGSTEDSVESGSLQVDLSKSVLDDFAKQVQGLLENWGFPGANRVYFDEVAGDIVIDGKPRASRGKGLRAITHAAMNIGLMEFCKEKDLPHPGFVVLDSPLLAYWAPEGMEDSLEGSDLKDRFYEYLAANHSDSQVIIVENEHPPAALEKRIGLTVFTKNPRQGCYGFFPAR